MFALIDCNNFFVSCERLFHPELNNKPILIISGDNGCIVARSNEAKALGFPMGAPLFKHHELVKRYSVITLCSNFELYNDLSKRVMQTLQTFSPHIEAYSVDEAFIPLSKNTPFEDLADSICKTVLHWTGIPVSIGIASTKTLAKLAVSIVKQQGFRENFLVLQNESMIDELLKKTEPCQIWGVGQGKNNLLKREQIFTAYQLKQSPDGLIQNLLGVTGLRTVWELKGIKCLDLHEVKETKKSILRSESFSSPTDDLQLLQAALSSHVAKAAQQLRRDNLVTKKLLVYVEKHPFDPARKNKFEQQIFLPFATSYTPDLIVNAKNGLETLYQEKTLYRKVGVLLNELSKKSSVHDFFNEEQDKQNKVMATMDDLNQKLGKNSLFSAAEGINTSWKTKKSNKTNSYTTNWGSLFKVKL